MKNLRVDLYLLIEVSSILRTANWDISVGVRDNKVIGIYPYSQDMLGIAIDLGTTKIAVYLVDLSTGENLAV